MNWYVEKSDHALEGSVQDIAEKTGQTIESVFANCKAAVLLDVSGSMKTYDVRNTEDGVSRSRFEAASKALENIQRLYKGHIAVICFSDNVKFCPAGMPVFEGGGTDLTSAMEYIFPLDGSGMKFIIITDGHPDNKVSCLELAKKFSEPFEIIGIGEGADREFLSKLGNFTGLTMETLSLEGIQQKLIGAAVEG